MTARKDFLWNKPYFFNLLYSFSLFGSSPSKPIQNLYPLLLTTKAVIKLQKKILANPAYQPVLSQLQEEITLIKQSETPLLIDEEPESSYLTQALEQLKEIAIDYTFIDLNRDGQKELLIGNPQKILAIYYLNQENQAVIALSAGRISQQREPRSLAIYEDGTIVIKYFTGQETTVQADSYRITNQNLLPVKNITYRLSDTTEPATLLGLDQVASIDTSSLFWYSFDE